MGKLVSKLWPCINCTINGRTKMSTAITKPVFAPVVRNLKASRNVLADDDGIKYYEG